MAVKPGKLITSTRGDPTDSVLPKIPFTIRAKAAISVLLIAIAPLWNGSLCRGQTPSSDPLPNITNMDDFWVASQATDRMDLAHPIDMEFTVLHYDPIWRNLWVETGGKGNYFPITREPFPFKSGDRVHAKGNIVPSAGLDVNRIEIAIVSENSFPDPLNITGKLSHYKDYDLKFVSLETYVDKEIHSSNSHVFYDTISGDQRIEIRLRPPNTNPIPEIEGRYISLQGLLVVAPGQDELPDSIVIWSDDVSSIKAIDKIESRISRAPLPRITNMDDFWVANQSNRQKDLVHPLDMEFTVLHYDPIWHILWVNIEGKGNYFPIIHKSFPFKSGNRVHIKGSIVPSAGLDADRIEIAVVSENSFPDPINITGKLSRYKNFDLKYVTLETYVDQEIYSTNSHLTFNTISGDRLIEFRVRPQSHSVCPKIEGHFISLKGLLIVTPNQDDLPDLITIWNDDVSCIVPVDTKESLLFAREPTAIENLPVADPDEGLRVEGLVYSQEPGKLLIVRDKTGQIVLQTEQNRMLEAGTLVEIVGYPMKRGTDWTLRNSIYRELDDKTGELRAHYSRAIPLQFRLVEQVLELEPKNLSSEHSAYLTGIITFADPDGRYLYLQDSSGGILVKPTTPIEQSYIVGKSASVKGAIVSGSFAPAILADEVVVGAMMPFPKPEKISYDQVVSGQSDGQWIEIEAYLEKREINGIWTHLLLSTIHGEFEAKVLTTDAPLEVKMGSAMRIQGVLSAHTDQQSLLESSELLVPEARFAEVIAEAIEEPYNLPITEMPDLLKYRVPKLAANPLRIHGVVTYHDPGKTLFLSDGTNVVRAISHSNTELNPSDRADVVGLLVREKNRAYLRNAQFRKAGIGRQPKPIAIQDDHQSIDISLDGHLTSFTGTLLEIAYSEDEVRLVVQNGETVLEAVCDRAKIGSHASEWESGAMVEVVGIYNIIYDNYSEPEEVSILMRGASDVTILEAAPWWSKELALTIAGICFFAFLAGGAWTVLLRRRIASQTKLIRSQLEREAMLEMQHREVVRNTSDFIFTIDLDGRFTSFNEAGELMTGYTREDSQTISVYSLFEKHQARRLRAVLERMRHLKNAVFEHRLIKKNGDKLWVEICAGFLRHQGEAIGAFGVMRDIDARKQILETLKRARDAAEETTKAKSSFLATMSHELRTPMNGIIGMTDLLLDLELEDQAREFAETIKESSSSLLVLLNDILDLSKAEAGKLSIDNQAFSIEEAIEQTVTLLETTAKAKNIELKMDLPKNLPASLIGDAGRLRQVILNLVGNAIKFTERGYVKLSVSIEKESDIEVSYRFEIVDTGIGIPEKSKSMLFQSFVQADASYTRRFGGTGLGLKISQEIVRLMKGDIGFHSKEGKGSIFWFTMPFKKGDQHANETGGSQDESVEVQWEGPELSVLVVEDTKINQIVTCAQLKKVGLDSDVAENGVEAIEAVQKKRYDIVFMDCQMPKMDGFEATRQLRLDPANDSIYIIALTANAMEGDRERCIDAGMNDYISKPTHHDALMVVMGNYAQFANIGLN